MNKQLPENIVRKTVEPLSGDSLKRYEEITKTDNNRDMDESYEIGGIPSGRQILKDTFDWVLPLLPKD